jgi:hypothetical protein
MTFDLVRYGWPNTIAVLALAVLPLIALALPAERAAAPTQIEQVEHTAPGAENIVVSMATE